MKTTIGALLVLTLSSPAAAAGLHDATQAALDKCLAGENAGSTAGQTECLAAAQTAYDRRLNTTYAALLKTLPDNAAKRLRQSQRSWIAFRDSERAAQDALFATRQGTMYVPMQAEEAMSLTKERALRLEAYRRVMRIEP